MSPKALIVLAWACTSVPVAAGIWAIASGSLMEIVGGGALIVWAALESEETARVTRRVWSDR